MIALLVSLTLVQLREDYVAAINQGEILVAAMVNAIDQHLGGSIRAIDGLLDDVATAVEAGQWPTAQFNEHLAARLGGFPEIRSIGLVDARGQLSPDTVPKFTGTESSVDVSDRDYFIAQRNAKGPSKVYIGAPVMSRVFGARAIHMSRPVHDIKGHFDGVVVAAISPDRYAQFLKTVLLEDAGGSAVIGLDGLVLARAPEHAEKFGSNISGSDLFTKLIPLGPVGVGHLVSRADGNEKLIGYRVMANYPLVVTSGLSMATALQRWYRLAAIEGMMVLLFGAALYYWAHQADIREGRLHEQQERLEDMVSERTEEVGRAREVAEQRALRLAMVNREFQRLADVTAHHLQEPVRPIVSYSQMIRRKLKDRDPELDGWLGFVERGGIALKAMLRDFQRYATILAQEPSPRQVSVKAMLTQVVSHLSREIQESGAKVEFGDFPEWVSADQLMLVNVLQQLIDNAIRHRHPDRVPNVVVQVEDGGPDWRFVVSDNGKGIEPAMMGKVFEAFERLEVLVPNSTGLGLAICRTVVQAHGGKIWIEPLPEGSRFCFTLPKVALASLDEQSA